MPAVLVAVAVVGVPAAAFAAWTGTGGWRIGPGEAPGPGDGAPGDDGEEEQDPVGAPPGEDGPQGDRTGKTGGSAPGGASEDGYVRTEEPEGFALSVPEGWERAPDGEEGAGAVYVAGDPRYRLQVMWQEAPGVAAWQEVDAILADASERSDYEELAYSDDGSAVEFEYAYDNTVHGPRYVKGSAFEGVPVHVVISAGPDDARDAVAEVHAAATEDFCADAALCG
ncbi:hypothetical protein [Nocardiopsis composta]|uniref:Uncharacterized protein n=1 Tax=Nocardiopsis composta TaxID=157465 RepID=A0A7W8VHE4_9ACTN|nr:hypothetical protein [Nocardiopsis composta]MBB5436090.1 hypothetical protein [Nocardiopsis composta]